jgi:hypothetical protein
MREYPDELIDEIARRFHILADPAWMMERGNRSCRSIDDEGTFALRRHVCCGLTAQHEWFAQIVADAATEPSSEPAATSGASAARG